MNEEQKAIAEEIFYMLDQEHIAPVEALNAMAALLQELIDAPEPKPVAWIMQNRLTQACYVYATEQPADPNHIQVPVYTAPPAPSVPEPAAKVLHVDGLLSNNLIDCDLPVGTLLYTAPAAPVATERNPELARDAERYRWLRTYNTAKHPAVTEAFFLGDENLDAEIDAAIAAKKGGQP